MTVTFALFHPAAFAGGAAALEIVSDWALKVTWTLEVAAFPAMSVASTVIVFAPAARLILQARLDAVTTAGRPLQVTAARPESASVTVPLRASCGVTTTAPGAGEVMPMTGGVLSSLTVVDVTAVLPVLSVTVPETDRFAVSAETVTGGGHVSGALPPPHAKETATFELFQPAALGGGAGTAEIVRLDEVNVTETEAFATFPAMSVACTAIALGPGTSVRLQVMFDVARVAGTPLQVTDASPESPSLAMPVRASWGVVTIVPGVGTVIAMSGGVLSSLTVKEVLAVLPVLSVTVPEMTRLAASVDATTGGGHVRGATPPEQVKATVTFVRFQPAAFGAGIGAAEIVSAGEPMITLTLVVALLPATSVA